MMVVQYAQHRKKGIVMEDIGILFRLMTQGSSINKTVSILKAQFFHNPVMITNRYFRVIAMNDEIDFDDAVWNYAKQYHCCSKESIEAFQVDDASKKLFHHGTSFLYNTNLGEKIPRILGRIMHKGVVYGYLIIFQVMHVFSKEETKRADMVCDALGVLLADTVGSTHLSYSRKEYFYRELLDMTLENHLDIENEIMQFKWEFQPMYKVLSLKEQDQKGKAYANYICNLINDLSKDTTAFVTENQILVVCNYAREEQIQATVDQIEKICVQYAYSCGISRLFFDLSKLRLYAKQALQAREIGRIVDHEQPIFPFSKYAYYALLQRYDQEELKTLICNEYVRLKEYDRRKNTELVQTCLHFYKHGLNISLTAEKLHVHRNTLFYRLNQIEEIAQCNIHDIECLDQIYHSSMIDHWRNKLFF